MAVVMLGSAFFACLSMTLAGLVRSRDRLMGIGQAITMPLFFASNALYPVDVMPAWLHVLSTVNPLSYEVHAPAGAADRHTVQPAGRRGVGGCGDSRNCHCINAFAAPGQIDHEYVTPPAEFDSAGGYFVLG